MKKEGLWVVFSFALLAIFTTYSNCGLHLVPDGSKQNVSSQTNNNPDQSVTESFIQPTSLTSQNKPEIIFVIDTSGSMAPRVDEIKTAVSGWVSQLQSQGVEDLCVGTMRGNTNAANLGRLISAPGNDKCYCTFGADAVSSTVLTNKLNENLTEVMNISAGGGVSEATLLSLHHALNDPAKLSANQADGCFRSETTLVPIVVGDENDAGASPNGGGFTFDQSKLLSPGQSFSSVRGNALFNKGGSGEENIRRNFYCRDDLGNLVTNSDGEYVNQIDHETVANDVKSFNGSFPSFGAAIGFFPTNLPSASLGWSEPFWGGIQFAQEFDTNMVDLRDAMEGNQNAFQNSMNQMADQLAASILYFYSFDLSEPVCDSDVDGDYLDEDITVKVNDGSVSFSELVVSANGIKVTFDESYVWNPGDVVSITYRPCQ